MYNTLTFKGLFLFVFVLLSNFINAQAILEADGPGNTYELINSVLAPGHNVVESPDCSHETFGRHIEEVFDSELNDYVFKFHIHTSPDDDRCINFDRQRNEIKTYDKSPDSLKGVENEMVQYKWKFKLDNTFQPSSSFSHLHQIKAVDGSESSMPSITLTARKGSPDKLELRYAEDFTQTTLYEKNLAPFKGTWVEAVETITYGEETVGEYEILITQCDNNDTLFEYQNTSIRMWKTDASFLRPKWGIYRSLNDSTSLKDEVVLFADFSIEELDNDVTSISDVVAAQIGFPVYPNPANEFIIFTDEAKHFFETYDIYNMNGQQVLSGSVNTKRVSIIPLESGIYIIDMKTKDSKARSYKILIE